MMSRDVTPTLGQMFMPTREKFSFIMQSDRSESVHSVLPDVLIINAILGSINKGCEKQDFKHSTVTRLLATVKYLNGANVLKKAIRQRMTISSKVARSPL